MVVAVMSAGSVVRGSSNDNSANKGDVDKVESAPRGRDLGNLTKETSVDPEKVNFGTIAKPNNIGIVEKILIVSLNVTVVGNGVLDAATSEDLIAIQPVAIDGSADSSWPGVDKSVDDPVVGLRNKSQHNNKLHVSLTDLGFETPPHNKVAPDKVGADGELTKIRDDHHEVVKKTCVTGLHTINSVGMLNDHQFPIVQTRQVGVWLRKADGENTITNTIKDEGTQCHT